MTIPDVVTCPKCCRELGSEYFGRSNKRRNGLQHWCKECASSYNRARNCNFDYRPHSTPKTCSRCSRELSADEFPISRKVKGGRSSWCKDCHAEYAAHKWRSDPKYIARLRNSQYRRKFGITLEQYEAMLVDQGGTCYVCKQPPNGRRLAVDHCHRTGRIRRLLCIECNRALGAVEDDPERLLALACYLESHRQGA